MKNLRYCNKPVYGAADLAFGGLRRTMGNKLKNMRPIRLLKSKVKTLHSEIKAIK